MPTFSTLKFAINGNVIPPDDACNINVVTDEGLSGIGTADDPLKSDTYFINADGQLEDSNGATWDIPHPAELDTTYIINADGELEDSQGNTWPIPHPVPDGSETMLTPGANVMISGSGTAADPYVITAAGAPPAPDVTSADGSVDVSGHDVSVTHTKNPNGSIVLNDGTIVHGHDLPTNSQGSLFGSMTITGGTPLGLLVTAASHTFVLTADAAVKISGFLQMYTNLGIAGSSLSGGTDVVYKIGLVIDGSPVTLANATNFSNQHPEHETVDYFETVELLSAGNHSIDISIEILINAMVSPDDLFPTQWSITTSPMPIL